MDIITLAAAKNYTDQKAGYVETTPKEVIVENEVKLTGNGCTISGFNLIAGITYIVKYNGKSYTCVATEIEGVGGALGNLDLVMDTGDNGMPFAMVNEGGNANFALLDGTANTIITLGLSILEETIHTIDPKYLPGVCLPVVELSTALVADEYVTLTDGESALLNEAYAGSVPFVLKATDTNGVAYSSVCNWAEIASEGGCAYADLLTRVILAMVNSDGCMVMLSAKE